MVQRNILSFLLMAALLCSAAMLSAQEVQISDPFMAIGRPTVTIAGASADTTPTPSSAVREAHIVWKFGTVVGTYTTCTAQAKTSYDGTNYLTLGTTVAVVATTGTTTAWSVFGQVGTTTVTTSAPSATAALSFGLFTKFTFNCAAFGTSAPVSITAIYR